MKPPIPDLRLNIDRDPVQLGALTLIAAILSLGATGGIASIAGFDAVHDRLAHPDWRWLLASAGGMLAEFCRLPAPTRASLRGDGRRAAKASRHGRRRRYRLPRGGPATAAAASRRC